MTHTRKTKGKKSWWFSYKREFLLGAIEGGALGGVITIATGGLGFLAIPIFGVLRGLDRVNQMRNIIKKLPKSFGGGPSSEVEWQWNLFKGSVSGAAYGAAFGFLFAGFTFGLSIPIGAAIGLGSALFNEYINHKAIKEKSNEPFLAGQVGLLGLFGGAALGLGILLTPLTGGLSLVVSAAIVGVGALVGGGLGVGLSNWISKQFGKTPYAKSTAVATTMGASGFALIGAGIGAVLSPFTLGLSIPLCALIGACVGGLGLGLLERKTGLFAENIKSTQFLEASYISNTITLGSNEVSNRNPVVKSTSSLDRLKKTDPDAYVDEISKRQKIAKLPVSTSANLASMGGSASHEAQQEPTVKGVDPSVAHPRPLVEDRSPDNFKPRSRNRGSS